jgi:exosortase
VTTLAIHPPADRIKVREALLLAAAALLFFAAFWRFFEVQWRWAISAPTDWAHTFLAPLGALWLLWLRREDLARLPGTPSRLGPLLVLLGGAWYTAATITALPIVNSHNSRGLGVVLALTGLVATALGRGSWRHLWFPALYLLVFAQCIGSRMLQPVTIELQRIAAAWGFLLIELVGFEAARSGTVISVFHGGAWHPVNVAEACSGIRMLPAVLAATVAVGWWLLDRTWTRLSLVAATVVLAIVFNALRIVFMALLAIWDAQILDGKVHQAISDLWTLPVLVVALVVAWALSPFNRDEEDPPLPADAPDPPPTPIRWVRGGGSVIASLALLALGGVGVRAACAALGIVPVKLEAPLREPLSTLPTILGGWQRVGEDQMLDGQVVEVLGTRHYLNRTYARDGDPAQGLLLLHIAFYSGDPDESPHVPEVCWVGQGLQIAAPALEIPLSLSIEGVRLDPNLVNLDTGEPYPLVDRPHPVTRAMRTAALPVGEPMLRLSRFRNPADPASLHLGGYFFIANGRTTPRASDVRSLAFTLYQRYAYFAKVEFDAVVPAALPEEESIGRYIAEVESLLSELLPELMFRLPDWPTLEREGRAR